MLKDHYDNPLSTTSDAGRAAYVAGVDHILCATYGAVEAFSDAVAEDPGFALGHAALARARMYAGDMPGAKDAIARAETLGGRTARERAHIAILSLLLQGKAAEAREAVRAHVLDHPRDVLIAQLNCSVFGLIGFSGLPGREADLFAFTNALRPHYGDDWWINSIHATSLCEIGRTQEALSLMDHAMDQRPDNANGAHFKSHSLYELGQTDQGLGYLTAWMADYDRRSLLHGHLSWHVALWSLAQGDPEAMWRLVDSGVDPEATTSLPINVLTDYASILYRAQVAGLAVEQGRWQAVSDYAATHFPVAGQSFADLHAALSHAMAGQPGRLAPYLEPLAGFAGDLVMHAARGFRALADGDWAQAVDHLTRAMIDHARLGGSRAQRDLLEFAYLHALVNCGKSDEARRWITVRRPSLAEDVPVAGLQ